MEPRHEDILMPDCLVCGKSDAYNIIRYFVIPGHIVAPNSYALCKEHIDIQYTFEDIYNEDGSRKPLTKKELNHVSQSVHD